MYVARQENLVNSTTRSGRNTPVLVTAIVSEGKVATATRVAHGI